MNVFVSRPTWVVAPFKPGLDAFLFRLAEFGLNPCTLGTTKYGTRSPLDEVIKLMETCCGAVVLGYPQIKALTGSIKDVEMVSPMIFPTEWNHIEAGLAYARKLPLLVVHHQGISRGIFAKGALNSFLFEKNLADPDWSASMDMLGALRAWHDDVLGYSPTPAAARNATATGINRDKNIVWSIVGIGRKIRDSRSAGSGYKERAECQIVETTDYYVRVKILASDEYITLPYRDVVLSYDDERRRPQLEVRV